MGHSFYPFFHPVFLIGTFSSLIFKEIILIGTQYPLHSLKHKVNGGISNTIKIRCHNLRLLLKTKSKLKKQEHIS